MSWSSGEESLAALRSVRAATAATPQTGLLDVVGRRRHQGRWGSGATDELGYHAVENRVMVADLHATLLHLLGLDHKRLTYHLHGRDERLTDVYDAKVLQPLLVSSSLDQEHGAATE